MKFASGTRLGDYVIVHCLGSGGMAEVYGAYRVGLGGFMQPVALKCLTEEAAEDEEFLSQFVNEAHTGSRLQHPNIVAIQDFNRVDGVYYIAMEYVDGVDLRLLMSHLKARNRRLSAPMAAHIMRMVLKALGYAYHCPQPDGQTLSVIHRDLKPANIMVNRLGQVKVADFGIAKAPWNPHKTRTDGLVKGTLPYMSPEQLVGKPLTAASDLFAAGTVLYELLTFERLFQGKPVTRLIERIQRAEVEEQLAQLEGDAAAFIPVLRQALAREPEDRFPDARAFGNALEPLCAMERDLVDLARDVAALLEETRSGFETLPTQEEWSRRHLTCARSFPSDSIGSSPDGGEEEPWMVATHASPPPQWPPPVPPNQGSLPCPSRSAQAVKGDSSNESVAPLPPYLAAAQERAAAAEPARSARATCSPKAAQHREKPVPPPLPIETTPEPEPTGQRETPDRTDSGLQDGASSRDPVGKEGGTGIHPGPDAPPIPPNGGLLRRSTSRTWIPQAAALLLAAGATLAAAFPAMDSSHLFPRSPNRTEAQLGETRYIRGSEMVAVTVMGAGADAWSASRVAAPMFFIDKHEVSVGDYLEFLQACPPGSGCGPDSPPGFLERLSREQLQAIEQDPVTFVSWNDANAYARWKGKRLPTVREWLLAARAAAARATETNRTEAGATTPSLRDDRTGMGLPSLLAGPLEWTADALPEKAGGKIAIGAPCPHPADPFAFSPTTRSLDPEVRSVNIGFRCVMDPPPHGAPGAPTVHDRMQEEGVLRVGVVTAAGDREGYVQSGLRAFDEAFFHQVAHHLGVSMVTVPDSQDRTAHRLASGEVALMVGFAPGTHPPETSLLLEHLTTRFVLLSHADRRNPGTLPGKVVGIPRGSRIEAALHDLIPGAIVVNISPGDAGSLLLRHRIDAALLARPVADRFVRTSSGRLQVACTLPTPAVYRAAVRRGERTLLLHLNRAIQAVQQDEAYARMLKEHLGIDPATRPLVRATGPGPTRLGPGLLLPDTTRTRTLARVPPGEDERPAP